VPPRSPISLSTL